MGVAHPQALPSRSAGVTVLPEFCPSVGHVCSSCSLGCVRETWCNSSESRQKFKSHTPGPLLCRAQLGLWSGSKVFPMQGPGQGPLDQSHSPQRSPSGNRLFSRPLCTPGRGRMWTCACKPPELGAAERAPWSRTLAAPTKDRSLVLSTHIGRLTTICNFSSRAFEPQASVGIDTHILISTSQHTVLHLSRVGFHSGL